MAYQVLYRTHRPSTFGEVVGQEYIIKTLKNAIKTNKIAHAYLFAGPRGTGKTTIAKLFAKAINCESFKDETCGKCKSCVASLNGGNQDIIEMDAASNNSVEDIRKIIEEVAYVPVNGKYKVYIIDEVHMLSDSAFNALLKTLEEPPEHIVFILATTDPQKVLPTVLSRCQRYNFSKITTYDMKKKMVEILNKEKIKFEDKALDEVAVLAEGGMRDALSILEQILSYNPDGVFLEDVEHIFGLSSSEEKIKLLINVHSKEIDKAISTLRNMYQNGIDIKRLAIDLLEIIKETIIYSDKGSDELLNKIKGHDAQRLLSLTGSQMLFNDVRLLEECVDSSRNSQNILNYLELCFIKIAGTVIEENKTVIVESKPKKKEIQKETIKEVIKEEPKKEVEEEIDLTYLAKILLGATKENKINDALMYNRLDLYKLEADKRKFYDALNGTELFASSNEALIVLASSAQKSLINSKIMNEELYNFMNNEFGIDKVCFALDFREKNKLIEAYKNLSSEDKKEKVVIKKYDFKKKETTEDKLKDMFGEIKVE